ncbi:MAG TPA: SDR family NAD(P)-dependent oxidoreductase [Tepidisphaeraceae bacterium]|jgi:NAD(P)-dependent dehydrogenase (short-subunit alcohol dehydrogenase family)
MLSLDGQIALVTGAAGGIGRAIALALARQGATLCLVGRTRESLEGVASEIGSGRAHVCACDLADDSQLTALPGLVERHAGAVDIVVHSAAAYFQEPLETAPVEEFDVQYRISLRAPYLLTQKLLPQLKRRRGQVVFINSSTGVNARAGVTQYAAVKHGLKGLADAFRLEIAPVGVRVISVYPGQTATPMQERRHRIEGKRYEPGKLIQPDDVASAVLNAVTMPRTAQATDVHVRPFGT